MEHVITIKTCVGYEEYTVFVLYTDLCVYLQSVRKSHACIVTSV